MDNPYRELLESSRVLSSTRKVLLQRSQQPTNYKPAAIRADLYLILQAVLKRLIPQDDRRDPIDIAARLDEQHFQGKGDGWRYADMPPDKEALERGLEFLDRDCRNRYDECFVGLNSDLQDRVLSAAQKGETRWPMLDSKRWFEQLLTDAVSIFVSHPDTLAEIGFSGIAILPRWQKIGLNDGEAWEPQASQDRLRNTSAG